MENLELYIDKNKQYWFVNPKGKSLICNVTNTIIDEDFVFIVSMLDRKSKSENNFTGILSLEGLKILKKRQITEVVTLIQAIICEETRLDFTKVFTQFVELGLSKNTDTIFSASEMQSENSELDNWDEAPLSKKGVSFEGASVGAPLIEENKLDDDEFGLIMSASPVEDKVLEDKSKDEGVDDEPRRID